MNLFDDVTRVCPPSPPPTQKAGGIREDRASSAPARPRVQRMWGVRQPTPVPRVRDPPCGHLPHHMASRPHEPHAPLIEGRDRGSRSRVAIEAAGPVALAPSGDVAARDAYRSQRPTSRRDLIGLACRVRQLMAHGASTRGACTAPSPHHMKPVTSRGGLPPPSVMPASGEGGPAECEASCARDICCGLECERQRLPASGGGVEVIRLTSPDMVVPRPREWRVCDDSRVGKTARLDAASAALARAAARAAACASRVRLSSCSKRKVACCPPEIALSTVSTLDAREARSFGARASKPEIFETPETRETLPACETRAETPAGAPSSSVCIAAKLVAEPAFGGAEPPRGP
jgi:hypothetical protein